ncbi:hypothetical protein LX32DRAFT_126704 [Colletotrichum zoysiae]|uniref:Uncharacterized protein n=1 Tax=Colletotrichum zoysiae TaxID=1216348 RepID=A0AAD9H7U0_9PEZI|nr:hypothetical protein LX32DRAFT_126704 [Colletotrichum zoysiae]
MERNRKGSVWQPHRCLFLSRLDHTTTHTPSPTMPPGSCRFTSFTPPPPFSSLPPLVSQVAGSRHVPGLFSFCSHRFGLTCFDNSAEETWRYQQRGGRRTRGTPRLGQTCCCEACFGGTLRHRIPPASTYGGGVHPPRLPKSGERKGERSGGVLTARLEMHSVLWYCFAWKDSGPRRRCAAHNLCPFSLCGVCLCACVRAGRVAEEYEEEDDEEGPGDPGRL